MTLTEVHAGQLVMPSRISPAAPVREAPYRAQPGESGSASL